MTSIGYWAAHEQYSMQELLKFVVEAEKCGFTSTMTSDHFHPWWHDNAHGNFTWIWIASGCQNAQKRCSLSLALLHQSTDIIQPSSHKLLHPLMYFIQVELDLGLGSGEAMNEPPLGFDWPRPGLGLQEQKRQSR